MKFKVGDKVKIVKVEQNTYNCYDKFIGRIETIKEVRDGERYPYKLEYIFDSWCDDELELVKRTDGSDSCGDTLTESSIRLAVKTLEEAPTIYNSPWLYCCGTNDYQTLGNNLTKPTGKTFMSVITNAFKSKENKALEHFDLGSSCALNERGKMEFLQYLFETKTEEREAFLAKLVEAHKEAK